MAEEELDISTSATAPPGAKSAKPTADAGEDHGRNHMKVSTPDLGVLVGPGASTEEFVKSLIEAPSLIPWEDCYLPSKGIYYGWPDGLVQVKAMGQTAEKILATQRLAASGQSLDYLFRECCRFPDGFDPVDLMLGDRIFLLYFLRGITHGNVYEFAVTCPNESCQTLNTHSYDLNELAGTIVWAKPELGNEPFKVVLPYMSNAAKREVWVGVRFLRAADANDMLAKRKTRKKFMARPGGGVRTNQNRGLGRMKGTDPREQGNQNQMLDDTISENLEKIIVSVMGIQDLFAIRQFIPKMHAQDTATVREWLREHTPGIDNTVTVECPDCGKDYTVELPITESFFRPAKSGGV